jgi:hypothetical protein
VQKVQQPAEHDEPQKSGQMQLPTWWQRWWEANARQPLDELQKRCADGLQQRFNAVVFISLWAWTCCRCHFCFSTPQLPSWSAFKTRCFRVTAKSWPQTRPSFQGITGTVNVQSLTSHVACPSIDIETCSRPLIHAPTTVLILNFLRSVGFLA